MTRRELLILAAAQTAFAQSRPSIGELIRTFEQQGNHRTGTAVDNESGDWLVDQVHGAGLTPQMEQFFVNRVEPVAGTLTINGRRIDGLPLFDAAFTDEQGIAGRLGPLNSEAAIGVTEGPPNAADTLEARRSGRHKAIVLVTHGGRPGLCPNNADEFLRPFGPPVLQVSSEEGDLLKASADAVLVAAAKRTRSSAFNVYTTIEGSDRSIAPLIVMTPRSGWWSCASERGGGIICWLELMRNLRSSKPARDILFVASTGHEVGYLGIEAFVANRPGIVKKAHAWIHFGANIGAAQEPGNTVQASDDEMEKMEVSAIAMAGLTVNRRVSRGRVPGGEAGVVHREGGRYMSLIGASALFHNPRDRGPEAIDVKAIAAFATAFTGIAKALSA